MRRGVIINVVNMIIVVGYVGEDTTTELGGTCEKRGKVLIILCIDCICGY